LNSFEAIDLLQAHPWSRAVFTTYALSLSFFEAVVLEALVRGGTRDALILADVEGVRSALNEQGARRAGREYEIEPIAVEKGVFHPKLSVLMAEEETHLLAGSGNLTFGGWGGNAEVVEHLHPSFAGRAFEDTADFFEELATRSGVQHGVLDACAATAEHLRMVGRAGQRNGNIRLLHSLGASILDQLVGVVEDLGGAQQLVIASPYWDNGTALDALCRRLRLNHAFVHVHPSTAAQGVHGLTWPAGSQVEVFPVILDALNQDETPRPLHAKVFEIMCRRGRVIMSGSANATTAAIGQFRNVEASVVRIQRQTLVGWSFKDTTAPMPLPPLDDEQKHSERPGVLRASLVGDRIEAQVLSPRMFGSVTIFQLTHLGPERLGTAELDENGSFSLETEALQMQWAKNERLILRAKREDGRFADGFVSNAAFKELKGRAGPMASRLIALIHGNETPADVAAIMVWLLEDPGRLGRRQQRSWGEGTRQAKGSETITSEGLNRGQSSGAPTQPPEHNGTAVWERIRDQLLESFREPRGPFATTEGNPLDDDEEDDPGDGRSMPRPPRPPRPPKADIAKALGNFEKLFDQLLTEHTRRKGLLLALTLADYFARRMTPEFFQVKYWLEKILSVIFETENLAVDPDDVAMIVLLLRSCDPPGIAADKRARRRLLSLGLKPDRIAPPDDALPGFRSVLAPNMESSHDLEEISKIRTNVEEVQAFIADLSTGEAGGEYLDLQAVPEWAILREAFNSERERRRIEIVSLPINHCPKCRFALPDSEARRLKNDGVATAKNCCGRVILCGKL
jgi:hypothetical protein